MLEHDPELYYDHGWVRFPEELLTDKFGAVLWLSDFDLIIYPGLNSREYKVTDIDENLTIMYGPNQPRRFPVTELYFHK